MQSVLSYCLMHCGFFIYGILLMYLLHKTIFFMLINFNKAYSYHVVYYYVVYFIINIEP